MKKLLALSAVVVCLGLFTIGCSKSSSTPAPSSGTTPAATEAPAAGGAPAAPAQ